MRDLLKKHLQEIIVGIFIFVAYLPTVIWMWDRWFARDSYYSHGILIPFVCIYLIWQKKTELAKTPRKSSPWGIGLLILGLLFHVASSAFRVYFSSGFSLILVLTGFVLHFYGSQVLRKIWFVLAFLVFMVPIPLYVITEISFRMKVFAAGIAEITLNNIGFPCIRDGSIIKMQHTYVIVDDVCSGLRSLISLMALGSVFAYLTKAPLYKRILLFLSTIPIAVVTNVFRIVLLSCVAETWGAKYTVGFFHDLTGFLVFALAFFLLFAVRKLL